MLKRTAIGVAVLLVVVGAWWWDHSHPGQPAWATAVLGALLMLGGLDELQRMGGAEPGRRLLGRFAGCAWLGLVLFAALRPNPFTTRVGLVLSAASLLAGAVVALQLGKGPGPTGAKLASSLWFQLPYVGGLACLIGLLLGGALDFCVMITLVAKASDTGAYFAGSLFGKHPLAPKISPKKTWEGVVGGLVLPAVVGAWLLPGLLVRPAPAATVAATFVPDDVTLGACMGAVLGVVAIVADLAESLLKRSRGVKDSSSLLGPAGGMLDLVDTLLLVGPIAVAYTALVA